MNINNNSVAGLGWARGRGVCMGWENWHDGEGGGVVTAPVSLLGVLSVLTPSSPSRGEEGRWDILIKVTQQGRVMRSRAKRGT